MFFFHNLKVHKNEEKISIISKIITKHSKFKNVLCPGGTSPCPCLWMPVKFFSFFKLNASSLTSTTIVEGSWNILIF